MALFQGLAGELVNVLREAGQIVPEALMKFGTHVKKKVYIYFQLSSGSQLLGICARVFTVHIHVQMIGVFSPFFRCSCFCVFCLFTCTVPVCACEM